MRKVPFQLAHLSLAGAAFELANVYKAVNVTQVGNLIAAVPLDTKYPPRFYSLEGVPVGHNGSYLVALLPPVTHKEPFSWERYLELKGKGVKVLTHSGTEVTQLVKFEGIPPSSQPLRGVSNGVVHSWSIDGAWWSTIESTPSANITTLEWEE